MIVPTSAKVGIAEFLKPFLVFGLRRVFLCLFRNRETVADYEVCLAKESVQR